MSTHTVKGLLGQPVITVNSGRRVGSIQEILFSAVDGRVTAIILSKPPVAGATKAVAAEHVTLLGIDVTLIDDESSVSPLAEPPSAVTGVRASTAVMRTQVITTEGRRVGEVSDIALDDQGNVLGYHLSHNILRDTFRGKPFLPAAVVRAVGDDAVIIDALGLPVAAAAEQPAAQTGAESPDGEVAQSEATGPLEAEPGGEDAAADQADAEPSASG
ncbi:MAG: PRC-barrel domain-containing protein [Anaerolineae bacterium]